MSTTLPEGIPTEPLSRYEEADLAIKIQTRQREEDINRLAMHGLCEAIPYLCTVCGGRVPQDELLSLSYEGLLHAARNFKHGRLRFFCYAKVYLRSALSKWWRQQDVVKNSSRFEDKNASDLTDGAWSKEQQEPAYEEINIRERWELVKPMLARLTVRERLVVELVHIGGFSYTKIAKMLTPSVSREAVRLCLARAMRKLHFALLEKRRTLSL